MSHELDRSGDAAVRVLAARASGAEVDLLDLELAGWVAGAAGRTPPLLQDAKEDLHVRQAAAFGGGHDEAGFALLAEHVDSEAGDRLLFHACHQVADRWPDRLIELAEQHRDVWFDGHMLARTREPARLLALVDADQRFQHMVSTVAELVIRGRDAGAVAPEIEARWGELNQRGKMPGNVASFREAELRLAARTDMERAIVLVNSLANGWGYDEQDDGTEAVFCRLVRVDPDRACQLVSRREDPDNRASWLSGLVRWHELPSAGEPLVDELLSRDLESSAIALASLLIVARATDRLDRALAKLGNEQPLDLASGLAVAVSLLRKAGLHDDAEVARGKVLAVIGDRRVAGELAPSDLFEMLSAPGRPPMLPWTPDPGMP